LAFSLLAVAIPAYCIVDEYWDIFTEFVSRIVPAIAVLFFAWLFLYNFLKLYVRPRDCFLPAGRRIVYPAVST